MFMKQILSDVIAQFALSEVVLLGVILLLLIFSRPLMGIFRKEGSDHGNGSKRLHIFRATNLLILLLILFYNLLLPFADRSFAITGLSALLVIYVGYLVFHVLDYLIKRRFGREREVGGKVVVSETYNSRVLSLITMVFVFIVVLIAVVRILGFNSLLEAGGVIGFVGVFLALTQSSWAPDIISGLIILNSKLVEEGDVIELSDECGTVGVVFKTKIFHTEILNLVNNHRIMLQNSRLRQSTLHNLSKFASAKGLREVLQFKIGYDVAESRVQELFEAAYNRAVEEAGLPIEAHPVEVRASEAGDFAVLWSVFYYTKEVRHILRTRQQFLALILQQAAQRGISLATPMRHELNTSGADLPGE
jgi:small-conductance mechanosensitive channel